MHISAIVALLCAAAAVMASPIVIISTIKIDKHTINPDLDLQILRKRAIPGSTSLAAVDVPTDTNVNYGVYVSCNKPKVFSLTFDDGPSDYSWDLAKDLSAQGVRAIYFINETDSVNTSDGKKTYMEIIKHYVDMGHELAGIKDADIRYQIDKQYDIIYKATGKKPAIMRPPAGVYDSNDLKILRQLGYSVVTWDIDTKDWKTHDLKGEQSAYESVKNDKPTILRFRPLAVKLEESLGYEPTTVADCLGVNACQ